jgi:hypothetical protein
VTDAEGRVLKSDPRSIEISTGGRLPEDANWHEVDEAHQQVIWPGYRAAIERIRDDLSDPERAGWFELTLDGERAGTYLGQPKLTRW